MAKETEWRSKKEKETLNEWKTFCHCAVWSAWSCTVITSRTIKLSNSLMLKRSERLKAKHAKKQKNKTQHNKKEAVYVHTRSLGHEKIKHNRPTQLRFLAQWGYASFQKCLCVFIQQHKKKPHALFFVWYCKRPCKDSLKKKKVKWKHVGQCWMIRLCCAHLCGWVCVSCMPVFALFSGTRGKKENYFYINAVNESVPSCFGLVLRIFGKERLRCQWKVTFLIWWPGLGENFDKS